MTALLCLWRRELRLAWAGGGGPLLALAFVAAATVAAPLAAGPVAQGLDRTGGGIALVFLALASLLSLDRLFERDLEEGALELLALGPAPLEILALVKCLAHWLAVGAPLTLAAPLAALALGAPLSAALVLLAAAAAAGLAFAFVGGIGASVAMAGRRAGVLVAVLVLPLILPPLVFAGASVWAAGEGLPWGRALALTAAYALGSVALAPFAMAAACRNALS